MAQQRSTRQYVFIGIRLVCIAVLLAIAIRDCRHGGILALAEDILLLLVMVAFIYSQAQGRKLASENMKNAGLNPDRDEALPARKAIDNRSLEI